ncbi:D-cysteine desulfhydrase (plasmid) [Arthrobacter sp. StoSoilB3]|nr:D-cysteine desulfhydrase [Arthrobacter sp. StoSoilB3]
MSEWRPRMAVLREKLSALPRERFAHLPTPLDRCPRLSEQLDGPSLWVKRDDCTGVAFGGNKTRQLEFVLGDALAQGADVVIQGAASQSNHSRQLAAAAARSGLQSIITPRKDKFFAKGGGNQLITSLLASEVRPVDPDKSVKEAKDQVAAELRHRGLKPYIVGMGAERALALAALAYAEALCEIVEEFDAKGEELPTHIYTTSQGSTQAGLQLAVNYLDLPIQVVGINPMTSSNEAYISPEGIAALMKLAIGLIGLGPVDFTPVVNTDAYVGDAYGIPSKGSREAIEILAKNEGILLDPIYSGKGFAGLIDHIRQGLLTRDSRVVFIHTGGLPALFADFEE